MEIEPQGEGRGDLRMGILASVIANIWRGKDSQPFTPDDFIPRFAVEAGDDIPIDEDELIAQQQAFFEALTLSAGGQVIDAEAA